MSRGAGLDVREVQLGERVEAGLQVDGWYDSVAHRLGGNVEERAALRLARRLGLCQGLGYKTFGGLMGKPLGAGLYGYLGVRVVLPGGK